jgi:hypothetical protein
MLKKFAIIFAMVGGGFLGACNNNTTEKASTATEATTEPEAEKATGVTETAQLAYMCPMQCEGSASNTPGKCPVCSMDLVKNPDYKGTAVADSAATL